MAKRSVSAEETGRKRQKVNEATTSDQFLSGCSVFVLPAGLGKARTAIFKKSLSSNGAKVYDKYDKEASYIVVDENMTSARFLKITNLSEDDFASSNAVVVKANWLSSCLSEGKLIPTTEFELFIKFVNGDDNLSKCSGSAQNVKTELLNTYPFDFNKKEIPSPTDKNDKIANDDSRNKKVDYDSDDSSYVPSDDDGDSGVAGGVGSSSDTSTPNASPTKLPKGNWVCAKPSTSQTVNHNADITEKLEVLMNAYKNTKDQWRALGYRKAISALKSHNKRVTSWEEANAIPGVGSRIADKIDEIIQSGHLRKIDHVCEGEEARTLDLFNKIWGVGPTVAQEFVQMGFKTLEDIRTKAKLTKQQRIGLNHYHDFLERMPREEAEEIGKTVETAAKEFDPNYICTTCGSFRRGKKTCGDVDVLISHLDGHSHKGILFKLLEKLHTSGFLTDDLIKVEERGEQKKYMGVCKLPGDDRKYRRLDIIVAPYSEYPCALVHFTGSDHFNRSIRLLAVKKGMSLSEHALKTGVIRRGKDKVHEGTPLPVTCEEDVFKHMGLEYRPPEERDY